MSLIQMHTEVKVCYTTSTDGYGLWRKEGQVTGIDDVGIMLRESGTEFFIPWTSVIHIQLS